MKKLVTAFSLLAILSSGVMVASAQSMGGGASSNSCVYLTSPQSLGSSDTTTGGQVSILQRFLINKGFLSTSTGNPTGYYGVQTVAAVKAYQASVGVSLTGSVGPLTRIAVARDTGCVQALTGATGKDKDIKYCMDGYTYDNNGSCIPKVNCTTSSSASTCTVPASLTNTSGFVAQTVSPNSAGVKIGSFTVMGGSAGINLGAAKVTLSFSGNMTAGSVSNLTIKSSGAVVGTPIGNAQLENTFTASFSVPAGMLRTYDVYADIGSAIGSVNTKLTLGDMSATGPMMSVASSQLAAPTLSQSSPVSQFVIGGTTFGIATFNVKTAQSGTQATVREMRFTTTGVDAMQSITVGGVTASVIGTGVTTVSGLNIAVSSTGTDVPVTVWFNGFQNTTSGGSLTNGIANVGLTLTYVEATSGSGVITTTTPASSNSFTLAASKPTVHVSLGNTDTLVLGAENKVGEFTITADANGKIGWTGASFSMSSVGVANVQFSGARIADGNTTIPGFNTVVSGGTVIVTKTPAYEIPAGQSKTFSVYATVTGTAQSGITPYVTSRFASPATFQWIDIIGGNAAQTGERIYSFPTNSYTTKRDGGTTPSAPAITGMTPSFGAAGTVFTVFGSGFTPAGNEIYLDYTPTGSSWYTLSTSANSNGASIAAGVPQMYPCPTYRNGGVGCPAPSAITPGTHTLTIKNTNGISNSISFTITGTTVAPTGVTISSITPSTGAVGTSLVITGTGFSGTGNSVRFSSPGVMVMSEQTNIRATECNTGPANGCSKITINVPSVLGNVGGNVVSITPGTYKVDIKNMNGDISNLVSFTVTSGIPTISSFTATPTTISSGQSTVLTWSADPRFGCTLKNMTTGNTEITSGDPQSSKTVSPTQTTTYKLMCSTPDYIPSSSGQGVPTYTAEKTVTVTVSGQGRCNSEQTLVNGVCTDNTKTYLCSNGVLVRVPIMVIINSSNAGDYCPTVTSMSPIGGSVGQTISGSIQGSNLANVNVVRFQKTTGELFTGTVTNKTATNVTFMINLSQAPVGTYAVAVASDRCTNTCSSNALTYTISPVSIPTTSASPTVEFIGGPSISIQYDSVGKESLLVGNATVKVTTGNTPVDAAVSNILQFNDGVSPISTMSRTFSAINSLTGSNSTYIPANTTATFTIRNTIKASELFAGRYSLSLTNLYYKIDNNVNSQTLLYSAFKNVAGSNSVIVVGETSPYIASAVVNTNGTITLTGQRLNLANNMLVIDGGGNSMVSKFNGSATTFTFPTSPYNLASGGHFIQINNSSTGNSNAYYVVTTAPATTSSAPTVEFVGSPTLTLMYDSAGRESYLLGKVNVKITTGNASIGLYERSVPGLMQFNVGGGATYTNNTKFEVAPSPTTIPANTTQTFLIADSVPTKELYSGVYTFAPANFTYINPASGTYETVQYTSFKNGVRSNAVTVVGETAPYINSAAYAVAQGNVGVIVLQGVRFGSEARVTIGNVTNVVPAANGAMLTLTASDFGITSAGTYVVQIANGEGASNRVSVNVSSVPVSSVTGTYMFYLNGSQTPNGTTNNTTQAAALSNCMTNHNGNPTSAIRCTWNGTEIYSFAAPTPITPVTPSVVPSVAPSSVGTYMFYLDGSQTPNGTTNNLFRVDALSNCMRNHDANPTLSIRCVWNGSEIYSFAAPVAPTTPVSSQTSQAVGFGAYRAGKGDSVTITIPQSAAGKVLVLSGYEAMNWELSNPNNVRVSKIILTGYNTQRVTGAVGSVPVESYSYKQGTDFAFTYTKTGASFEKLASFLGAKGITISASNFYGAYNADNIPSVLGVSISALCTDLPYNFHRGNESLSVKNLQSFLISSGYMDGEVTGFYGDKTVEGVKTYQGTKGLPVTGMVYDFTRSAIKADSCQ